MLLTKKEMATSLHSLASAHPPAYLPTQTGNMDVKLMKDEKLTPKDMALHLALMQEYVWTVLTPGDEGKVGGWVVEVGG